MQRKKKQEAEAARAPQGLAPSLPDRRYPEAVLDSIDVHKMSLTCTVLVEDDSGRARAASETRQYRTYGAELRLLVRRQLLSPVALPHLGMLPTVLRKIVLRFQPGTGQFLVTRPARARWRDSIGGNVSAHHRVSCPVHAGARHAGGLVDHHGLYGTGCRRRRRRRAPDTGH